MQFISPSTLFCPQEQLRIIKWHKMGMMTFSFLFFIVSKNFILAICLIKCSLLLSLLSLWCRNWLFYRFAIGTILSCNCCFHYKWQQKFSKVKFSNDHHSYTLIIHIVLLTFSFYNILGTLNMLAILRFIQNLLFY